MIVRRKKLAFSTNYAMIHFAVLLNTLRSSEAVKKFLKIGALKNFALFTEKHLRWSLFFNKFASLNACNFFKKRLQHRCFAVNIAKFLRTASFIEHLRWLLSDLKKYDY